jgi:hypothetical protein
VTPRPFSYPQIAISAGVINALINAPIGYAIVPAGQSLPLWGGPGVAADVVATAFGIAFGTALVVTPQIRRQVGQGKLTPPVLSEYWAKSYAGWPSGLVKRAINLGVLSVLLAAPLPIALLALSGVEGLDRTQMIWLKGVLGFVIGALETPPIAAAATVASRVEGER